MQVSRRPVPPLLSPSRQTSYPDQNERARTDAEPFASFSSRSRSLLRAVSPRAASPALAPRVCFDKRSLGSASSPSRLAAVRHMPDASVVRNRSRRSAFADVDSPSRPDDSHYPASPKSTLRHASTASSSPPSTHATGSCSRTPTRDSPMLRSPSRCSVANPAQPSVAISRTEPDFSFKTQPSSHQRSARPTNQSAPRGKLAVKLIEARSLSAPSRASRPYVVVTFDQNEFVSREPIDELAGDAVGVAKPRPTDAPAAGEPTRVPPPATPSGTTAPETETMAVPIVATPNTSSSNGAGQEGGAMPPGAAKSPSSALGRSLEEYRNGALSAGTVREPPSSSTSTTPAAPQSELQESASKAGPTTERAERPTLRPVDTNTGGRWQASDDPTTPTSAPKNGGMLGAPDDSMAYNPTWKHEVTLCVPLLVFSSADMIEFC